MGDDGVGASLAACRGDRQDGADAQSFFNRLSAVEVPEIAIVDSACRDRF